MFINYTNKELEAIHQMRNFYIYNGCLPSVRELQIALRYKSPRSAALIINSLIKKGALQKSEDGYLKLNVDKELVDDSNHAETTNVPLVGAVSCGVPILATENVEAYIPVSIKLANPSNKYFLLKAKGDSMNDKGINDGDLVLVKQQQKADNGDMVVALIDGEATVKEIQYNYEEKTILLKPRSKDKKYQPIILTTDFNIQGVVVAVIPKS